VRDRGDQGHVDRLQQVAQILRPVRTTQLEIRQAIEVRTQNTAAQEPKADRTTLQPPNDLQENPPAFGFGHIPHKSYPQPWSGRVARVDRVGLGAAADDHDLVCERSAKRRTELVAHELMSVPDDLACSNLQSVGRYALAIKFADGHHSGVYPFTLLRQLCQCKTCAKT
jgi:hypothetical protein